MKRRDLGRRGQRTRLTSAAESNWVPSAALAVPMPITMAPLRMSQEDLEDELEELMARTVLEELGLPPDAVRNILVLGTASAAAAPHSHDSATQQRLLPGTVGNAGSVGGASPHALVVMGGGGEGGGGVVQGKGRNGSSEAMRAQVFKLVGKVVQVRGPGGRLGILRCAAALIL